MLSGPLLGGRETRNALFSRILLLLGLQALALVTVVWFYPVRLVDCTNFQSQPANQGKLDALPAADVLQLVDHALSSRQEEQLMIYAQAIQNRWGFVYFMTVTPNFGEIVSSFICNLRLLNSTIIDKILFVSNNREYTQSVKEIDGADVHILTIDSDIFVGGQAASVEVFGTLSYWEQVMRRLQMIAKLLKGGINLFVVEADAAWFDEPVLYDGFADVLDGKADSAIISDGTKVAAGLHFDRGIELSAALYEELIDTIHRLGPGDNEQSTLTALYNNAIANGSLRVSHQKPDRWPVGLFYEDVNYRNQYNHYRPVVLNNNWIVGVDAKIDRAKLFGHWFLLGYDNGTAQCVTDWPSNAFALFPTNTTEDDTQSGL